jgi:hypothetical protein
MDRPVKPTQSTPDQAPGTKGSDEPPPPGRYDANLRLIRRRLADEQRSNKSKKWWKPKS